MFTSVLNCTQWHEEQWLRRWYHHDTNQVPELSWFCIDTDYESIYILKKMFCPHPPSLITALSLSSFYFRMFGRFDLSTCSNQLEGTGPGKAVSDINVIIIIIIIVIIAIIVIIIIIIVIIVVYILSSSYFIIIPYPPPCTSLSRSTSFRRFNKSSPDAETSSRPPQDYPVTGFNWPVLWQYYCHHLCPYQLKVSSPMKMLNWSKSGCPGHFLHKL